MENIDELKRIYLSYLNNQCSRTDVETLFRIFDIGDERLLKDLIESQLHIPFDDDVPSVEEETKLLRIFGSVKMITHAAKVKIIPFYKRQLFLKYAAACITLTVISVSFLVYRIHNGKSSLVQMENDFDPGKNKAVLTLADGRQILLSDGADTSLADQNGVKITKTGTGQLIYTFSGSKKGKLGIEENHITTPRGGQYQLQLSDGTKIWLNAASSVKFPVSFQGPKRNVELEGEAYFEVAKDKAHPFIVKSVNQELQVLGTHFNLKVYRGGIYTKTTLLEGSVKVNQVILRPGEQSTLTDGRISVKSVDTDNAVSWKDGFFNFDDEPLENILADISQWYDLEIRFKDEELRKKVFSGRISKYLKVSQVLNKLVLTRSVRFEIQGRTVIVMK